MNLSRLNLIILIIFSMLNFQLNPQFKFLKQICLLSYLGNLHLIEPLTPNLQAKIKILRSGPNVQ
ncbi:MAG: hypothetical protein A2Y71_08125 [Bacteroidetes bacterium RBG_13_42_15]|nr:MAG: hypothetical protein A2Y71_08125 [Bacteroidetes bacterium RBG_13_42_15]